MSFGKALVRVAGAALLTAGLLTGCGKGSTSAVPSPYVAQDVGFKAVFPQTPKRSVRTVQNKDGSVDVTIFEVVQGSEDLGVNYAKGARSLTGDVLQKALDAAIDSEATGFSGTVSTRSNVSYLGQPAEEAVINRTGTILRTRVLFVGTKFFAMYGTAPSATAPHPGYDKLVATFQAS